MAAVNGLSGNDTIIGSSGSDKLIAGAGNDTIDGGAGSDFINAGGGNDTIVYGETDYKILGGGGIDTLWFTGSGQKLNLSLGIVSGIEKLWLDGGRGHSVWLNAADIIRVSDSDQMIITGDASDRIHPGTGWSFSGLTSDGQSQILTNGMAKIIVSLPVFVEGFSGNAMVSVSPGDGNTVTEDVPDDQAMLLTTAGTIRLSDINSGQNYLLDKVVQSGAMLGSLQLGTPTGNDTSRAYSYIYSVDNAKIQYLGEGKTEKTYFTVTSLDGTTATLEFILLGRNDKATISNIAVAGADLTEDQNVTQDGYLFNTGTVTLSDPDQGESGFDGLQLIGSMGGMLTIDPVGTQNADNSYTHTFTYKILNSSVQSLKSGESSNDQFTIKSLDGTTRNISLSIKGADDAATITIPTIADLTEDQALSDGKLTRTGTLTVADPDHDDAFFQTTTTPVGTNLGTLTLGANGNFTYAIDNDKVDYLKAVQSLVETFKIKSLDGTSKDISFTINGENDKPVLHDIASAKISDSVVELPSADSNAEKDLVLTKTGSFKVLDADLGDTLVANTGSASMTGKYGNLGFVISDAADHVRTITWTYSYTDKNLNHLPAGPAQDEVFNIQLKDSAGELVSQEITIKVTGANDPATIGLPSPNSVTEDKDVDAFGNLSVSGNLSIADPDDNQAAFLSTTAPATNYGSIALKILGGYTYTVKNSLVQKLNSGQSITDYFSVKSKDGTTQTISFVINGVNEEQLGTDGDDTINGTAGDDVISGLKGNDTINGLDGDDTLRGNEGNDTILGGAGYDSLYGGPGNDDIQGGTGFSYIDGGDDNDLITVSDLLGGRIFGGNGEDTIKFTVSSTSLLEINGGRDSDAFMLFLDTSQSPYLNTASINDFDALSPQNQGGDVLLLQGFPSDYTFSVEGGGLRIYYLTKDASLPIETPVLYLVGVNIDATTLMNNGHLSFHN
jgi:VCBS repeat-containing protein